MAIASEGKEKMEPPAPAEQSRRSSPTHSAAAAAAAAAKQDAEAASDTSSVHSAENSDRKDVDILTHVLSARSEEYRLLFRLPPDEILHTLRKAKKEKAGNDVKKPFSYGGEENHEGKDDCRNKVLVQDFNCALQENILLQGHMYLFVHHICFYSNIFGFETKKTISFYEVTCVRKAKTAAIFPNAIEIIAGGKKHFFASFLSRDEAYRLILDGWAQHSSDPKAILDHQELKSDTSSQDNILMSERSSGCIQLTDDLLNSDRNKDGNISGDSKSLCNGENNVKVLMLSEAKENGQHSGQLSSGDILTWQFEDVDAPKIPEHFTMVAEATFAVRAEDFLILCLSDRAADFLDNFHRRCGDKDFRCAPWRKHEQAGYTREISFLHPVKFPIGAKFGHCQEVQKLHIYRNSHVVIETSQQISNVPFGDYFKVEGIWDVEENTEESGCTLRVYSNVAFSKKTMFKGKIEQSTKEECREVYGLWINLAHDLLRQRNVENQEGACGQKTELVQVGLESSFEVGGHPEESPETCRMILPVLLDKRNFNSRINSPREGNFGFSTTISSTVKYLWDTACSYLTSQGHLPSILLLAFAAIFILLQISIIILLTRGPKVHLVTQGNCIGSINSYSVENVEWLEKHFNRLKEEMLMLETRMERMRLEYTLLKDHLQSLEKLKSKL